MKRKGFGSYPNMHNFVLLGAWIPLLLNNLTLLIQLLTIILNFILSFILLAFFTHDFGSKFLLYCQVFHFFTLVFAAEADVSRRCLFEKLVNFLAMVSIVMVPIFEKE